VLVLSTKDFSVTKAFNVGVTPSGIVFNKKYNFIVITSRDENLVEIYNATDYSLYKKIKVGSHPYGISTSDKFIYVTNVYDDTISIINIKNWEQKVIKVGLHPYNVISHMGKAYVTNAQGDNISVIDLITFKEIKKINTGETPENISVDKVNGTLIVSNWGSDSITIIDIKTQKPIKQIKTGLQSRAFGQFIYTK
jgi:YVTN family beta-propeller protein